MDMKILCSISCFILFLTKDVSSLVITVGSSTTPAVLGNHQFLLHCQYTLSPGDRSLFAITLNRKRASETNFNTIVTFEPPESSLNASYSNGALDLLESRTVVTNPTDVTKQATLKFQEVQCRDKAEYQWDAMYRAATAVDHAIKTITMDIKAKPTLSVKDIVAYDTTKSYREGDNITFTCQGGVGSNPQGDLQWYYYRSTSAVAVPVTSRVVVGPTVMITDCTYNKSSTMTLTLSKELNDFIVRCTVHQDMFTAEGNGKTESQPIPVQYEPRVSPIVTNPIQPSYEVGTAELTLACTGDANPNPSFYWVRPDDSQHVGDSLTLNNLALNMTGVYTCVVWNEINGQNYTVNTTVNISVVETTTPPSTTTTSSTAVPGPTSQPVTDPDDGMSTTTIIIIVVCVAAGILISVIAVVVFIKFKGRKRPEIEEPPEKPRNNQDLSFYGNARPDLVSTDMKPSTHTLNASFNNSFDSSESKPRNEDLMYVDLAFDDKPRSRRPIQLLDNSSMGSSTPYADIAMPRV